jgi:tetratricopeptide (TPR) repeat protein
MRIIVLLASLLVSGAFVGSSAQTASAEALWDIGNTLMRRDKPLDAINAYQEALQLRPDFHQARRALGFALMRLSRHAEAEQEFYRIVEATPQDAGAHYDLGAALAARGQLENALASYQTALRLQPGFAQARLAVVSTLTTLKRPVEAIAVLHEAPRKDEPTSATLGRRARDAHAAGQHARAVVLWTQALEIEPGYFDAREAERVLWNASVAAVTGRTTRPPERAP